jgi:hypothetical protein
MRYDAYLSKGDSKRRVVLDLDIEFKPGDEFKHENGIYAVTRIEPGEDGFDFAMFAELVADNVG